MKFYIGGIILLLLFKQIYSQDKKELQLNPHNPHYFQYQHKPLILIGSGEHYGSVVNLDFDYKKYLKTLAEEGLNLTRLFTGAYIEKNGDFGIQKNTLAPLPSQLILPWKRSNTEGFTLGGNKFDLNEWDEKYFNRLKDFMRTAGNYGIIVEVNLFSAYYSSGWNYSAFNPKNNINGTDSIPSILANTLNNGNISWHQERYVRKLAKELSSFDNFYFEVQNEPWADQSDTVIEHNQYGAANDWRSTIQVVSRLSNKWQHEVTRWIRSEEDQAGTRHLISQNISNFFFPITEPNPDISIFNFHYALPETVTQNYYLDKVIGCNETGFAGHQDITYRRQAWRFIFAGGGLFNHLDYSFSVGNENGKDSSYAAPGGGSAALRKQLGFLKQVIENLDFIHLQPDHSVVATAPGAKVEAMSDKHSEYVIYYEPMISDQEVLGLNIPAGHFEATWSDVETGKEIKREIIRNGKLTIPKGAKDKVAVIKMVK